MLLLLEAAGGCCGCCVAGVGVGAGAVVWVGVGVGVVVGGLDGALCRAGSGGSTSVASAGIPCRTQTLSAH